MEKKIEDVNQLLETTQKQIDDHKNIDDNLVIKNIEEQIFKLSQRRANKNFHSLAVIMKELVVFYLQIEKKMNEDTDMPKNI